MVIKSGEKGWIGVDIGTRTIKLAQVERARHGLRLSEAMIVQRRTPWTDGDENLSATPAQSHEEISAALALSERFVGRTAACVLPMGVHDVRALRIPAGAESERRAMIASELESVFEGESGAREIGFWDVNAKGKTEKQGAKNVSVLSLTRPWASQAATDLARAKLKCQALDGPPLAIARAVQMALPTPTAGPVAAVDWGFSSTTFGVIVDGRPLYTRCLRDCSLGQVIRSVRNALDVSLDEAQHLLTAYGLPDPENRDDGHEDIRAIVGDAAAGSLNEFVEQLSKTLAYYSAQWPGLSPKQIWIFGGGATVRGMINYLSRAIPLPIDVWRLPQVHSKTETQQTSPPALLATAIALSTLAWTDE